MEIKVLLFGSAAATAHSPHLLVRTDSPTTAATLHAALLTQHAALAPLLRPGRLAINHAFAAPTTPITSTDEVALITPVSGG